MIEMVAVATGRERAWVDSLDLDQLIVLAEKIVEVNAAFFSQRTLPVLNRAIRDLTAYLGGLSSSASSSTDTGSGTFESYTLMQVRVFLTAIARSEREKHRTQLLLMRAAQADGKGFERVWKSLGANE